MRVWSIGFILLLSHCHPKKPGGIPVLERHFTPLTSALAEAAQSDGFSLPPEFERLCAGLPRSMPAIKQLLKEKKISDSLLAMGDEFIATLAGCRTWFKMTDRAVEKDFAKVLAVTKPDAALHCASVGFVQPWIMAASLPCEHLTFIDLSAKTLNLHRRLVDKALKTGGKPDFAEFLQQNDLQDNTAKQASVKKDLTDNLCPAHNANICADFFKRAAAKMPRMKSIRFIWGELTEASDLLIIKNTTTVFYVSNAIDEKFTSADRFDAFQRKYASATGGSGLVVYHMGSEKKFAIYQFNESGKIQTICADRFIVQPKAYKDPCYIKPIQPDSYEMLTLADKIAGDKIGSKQHSCSE
jgi:hypothetical protein